MMNSLFAMRLKICRPKRSCRFDSGLRHYSRREWLQTSSNGWAKSLRNRSRNDGFGEPHHRVEAPLIHRYVRDETDDANIAVDVSQFAVDSINARRERCSARLRVVLQRKTGHFASTIGTPDDLRELAQRDEGMPFGSLRAPLRVEIHALRPLGKPSPCGIGNVTAFAGPQRRQAHWTRRFFCVFDLARPHKRRHRLTRATEVIPPHRFGVIRAKRYVPLAIWAHVIAIGNPDLAVSACPPMGAEAREVWTHPVIICSALPQAK